MGLFGGLFNKEPQEVKEFWKAFNNLLGKSNQKNFDAMVTASAACPDIWQGPFLLGLVVDQKNDIPYDEMKANEYHYMAKKIAAKGPNAQWVDTFYEFYESSAINSKYPELFNREELATRRLGVAAMNMYTNMQPVVYAHEKNDDATFWRKLFLSNCDYEQSSPFSDIFSAWESYKGGKGDQSWQLDLTNDYIKATNKIVKLREKIKKKDEKGQEVYEGDRKKALGLRGYAWACSLIYANPFVFKNWNMLDKYGSEFTVGINELVVEASYCDVASAHMLVNLYHSDDAEVCNMTRNAYRRVAQDVSDDFLFNCLLSGAKSGDAECAKLLQQYYVKE